MSRPAVQVEYEAIENGLIQAAERRFKGYRARAVEVAADLMERAQSEAVRMRAVEFFRGEARGPAVAVQVNVPQAQGYIYTRADHRSGADAGQVIDGTAEEGKAE